ncbi:hypothetical protein DZA65_03204 [Dickeya dianthicola]|uniref:hypothetical protein n=1 Tax=Dickeya dianthicola TaxID=204039 RepID=UPI000CD41786|nr:hypothetical protein [Dickeya dianthicola]AYC20079.1 hypothetical protein DZA65_03204 [Dickeya dianthicola]MBI0437128.1 hypothetical protein [Dickeya dianthicola]MBI0448662.1 hypothetical protein [Dickeya dianthicola]MBI0452089.1 hypothetical protein [Dickeya dianthicola]MBI0456333.1 hypothetical protein [Dickeya dianthicola]
MSTTEPVNNTYTLPVSGITEEHRRVIGLLLGVCASAFELADDSCECELDGEQCVTAPRDSFAKLSDWLDEIENTLPDKYDDLPNTALQWAAIPRHALRSLLQPANSPVIPEGWKLVPVEPTEAMMLVLGMTGSFESMIAKYCKMLAAAPQPDQVSAAVRDVIAERQRQMTAEGWTPEHDDEHVGFEMSFAAATYILHIAQSYGGQQYKHIAPSEMWPWDLKWLKFTPGPRRSLVKAAALILAEIDRLDRTSQSEGGNHGI